MFSWWCRWLLTICLGLGASMYAMDTVRLVAGMPQLPQQAKQQKHDAPPPAGAIAKASQMDKVADALRDAK